MRPILDRDFPDFEYTAALIGYGSEVLGLDDEMSRDHNWGPRVLIFTANGSLRTEVQERLSRELPTMFSGFPLDFGEPVRVLDLGAYLRERIGCDPRDGLDAADWLRTPTQRLLELTSGAVFFDADGELTRAREQLAWYPHDVWLYVMAGHWQRLAEYEHFVGRTGFRADDPGSRLITASLVRDIVRLGFLQRRRYAPYAKWLGTAYAELELPEREALTRALEADDWQTREHALGEALEAVARRHNDLRVTDDVEPTARQFWGRPFRVLFADRFTHALLAAITDPAVRALAHPLGGIDAVSDNTVLLERPELWKQVRLYDRT